MAKLLFKKHAKISAEKPALRQKEEYYEPQEILDYRFLNNRHEYLIRWKDYPIKDSTWERFKHIRHCTWLFEEWQEYSFNRTTSKLNKSFQSIEGASDTNPKYLLIRYTDKTTDWIPASTMKKFNNEFVLDFYRKHREGMINETIEGFELKEPHLQRYYLKEMAIAKNCMLSEDDSNSDCKQNEKQKHHPLVLRKESSESTDSTESFEKKKIKQEQITTTPPQKKMNARNSPKQISNKPNREPLPAHGILGQDIPDVILNMVIDKNIGAKTDGYFACDVSWKVRANMQMPQNSRVSRMNLKSMHPMVLISFYEDNLTFEAQTDSSITSDSFSENSNLNPATIPQSATRSVADVPNQRNHSKFKSTANAVIAQASTTNTAQTIKQYHEVIPQSLPHRESTTPTSYRRDKSPTSNDQIKSRKSHPVLKNNEVVAAFKLEDQNHLKKHPLFMKILD